MRFLGSHPYHSRRSNELFFTMVSTVFGLWFLFFGFTMVSYFHAGLRIDPRNLSYFWARNQSIDCFGQLVFSHMGGDFVLQGGAPVR